MKERISPSRIRCFFECEYKYYLRYKKELPSPDKFSLARGSCLHRWVERYLKDGTEIDIKEELNKEVSEELLGIEKVDPFIDYCYATTRTVRGKEQARTPLVEYMKVKLSEYDFTGAVVENNEEETREESFCYFELPEAIIRCIPDLYIPGKEVWDWKFVGQKPKDENIPPGKRWNLQISINAIATECPVGVIASWALTAQPNFYPVYYPINRDYSIELIRSYVRKFLTVNQEKSWARTGRVNSCPWCPCEYEDECLKGEENGRVYLP